MAEKVIQTRIINKHGKLADWLTSTTVLKEGEIALAYVETTKPDGQGGTYTVPTYLMKVGDGTNTFSGLEWVVAPASDVYAWAKKANLALSDIPMADVKTNLQDTFYTESEIDGKISTINTAINGKAASSHVHGNIANGGTLSAASMVVVTDANKKITTSSTISTTELGYLDGVTSKIQDQLNAKAAKATTLAGYEIGDAYTKGEIDAALVGKSDTHGHPYLPDTTKYAASSSVGGAANKVANKIIVKLNSGSTEGTNLFTFDGSAAKTINITPSAIGASASGHNHNDTYYTESEIETKLAGKSDTSHNHDSIYYKKTEVDTKISSAVSSVLRYQGTKNTTADLPTSGQVKGDVWNISSACNANSDKNLPAVNAGDNVAWNGTGWDVLAGTVDLSGYYTSSAVDSKLAGKSDTDHTHNYAGSSSAGGAANSVKASLTFNNAGSGAASGTTFNGSAAKTISYNTIGAAAASHTHTKSEITDFAHNHDDLYYTESEIDTKLAGKANSSHNQASNTINAMTGYSKPSSTSAISTSDTLNSAIGKLEKALDGKGTSNLTLGTTATTAAAGNHTHDGRYYTESESDAKFAPIGHTHDVSIAASSGTNELTLAHGTKYALTAGGQSFVFTMPNDSNTHYTKYLQIKGNGTEAIKYTQDSDKSLNLKPGTNISISAASGEITVSAPNVYTKSEVDSKIGAIFNEIVFDCGGPNN